MRRFVALCLIGLFLAMPFVVAGDNTLPHGSSATANASGGCAFIRVQYVDGYPRSGADVAYIWPEPADFIGTTDEDGIVWCTSLSYPQDYLVQAAYRSNQFGQTEGLYIDENGCGSTIIQAGFEITPPAIAVLSPQNQQYTNRTFPLTYTICDYSSISWTGYSLDGEANTTIAGNTTLTNILTGYHNVAVYSNDTFGNMGSSGTVYFWTIARFAALVRYKDGCPRQGAIVRVYNFGGTELLGMCYPYTNETGQCQHDYFHLVPYTWYLVNATWPDGTTPFAPTYAFRTDGNTWGSAVLTANYEITPPIIGILSPQNQTYDGRLVPLNFTVYDYSPISWMGYSLDGQANTTVTGNITLNVNAGTHNVVVHANDTYGNMGSSDVVYFSSLGGCVVVRVQYLDGAPRFGADVCRRVPLQYLGITNSTGQLECDLAPGDCMIYAVYAGSQFGSDVYLGVDENGYGSATITANYEITPPDITILSPQNQTYYNSSVPLNFTVYNYSPVSWMGYSLDNQANVTINGNTTLTGLSQGSHGIIVYANDTAGNMGVSGTVYFAMVDITPPIVVVFSPLGATYYSNSVPLTFAVVDDFLTEPSWTGYSLDGEANVTVTGNTTLSLTNGAHRIIVYANDTSGNMGSSETVHFAVNSSFYDPWKSSFIALDSYPVVDFAVYNGSLYAAADSRLYAYDGSSWNVVDAPAFVTSLEPYGGKLVVGGKGGLYCYDGTSFSLIFSVPTYIKVLGAYNNALYAGTVLDNPPKLYYCNGPPENSANWQIDTGFSSILNFSGAFGSIDSFAVYDGKMYVASGNTVYCFDGTGWSVALSYEYAYAFLDMQVYDGKLYLATRDLNRIPLYMGGTGFSGTLIEYDGENWATILGHDYWVYSLEVYDGKLYVGTANRIYTYNGTAWDVSFYAENGAFYAISMITYNDKIYAGMGNGYIFADPAPAKAEQETITVPEFSSTAILAVFMALTMLAVALTRKNRSGRFS